MSIIWLRIILVSTRQLLLRTMILMVMLCICNLAHTQDSLDKEIDFDISNSFLVDCLWELSEISGLAMSYSDSDIPSTKVSFSFRQKPVSYILDQILGNTQLAYNYQANHVIIYKAVKNITISGYIEDASSGERLIGASVYSPVSKNGTVTNIYGFYTIEVNEIDPTINVSYIGYDSQSVYAKIKVKELIVQMQPNLTFDEVIVTEKSAFDINSYEGFFSDQNLAQDLNNLPALGGELDYMRLLELQPGVQSGTDGLGGLYVRGGNADQNLVLLDGVAIYNPYHALGLISIFDEQVVKKVSYYRGQFPSRYGGMISSVVDVRTIEGNNKEYKLNVGTGLIASKIKVEGPYASGKGSFLISGRRTHLDPFLRKYSNEKRAKEDIEGFFDYSFGEFMAKANYAFSPSNKLFLSLYRGADSYQSEESESESTDQYVYSSSEKQKLEWGNSVGSLRWHYQFADKLFGNITATYSSFFFDSQEDYFWGYDNGVDRDQFFFKEAYLSNITNLAAKIDLDYVPNNNHYIRTGFEFSRSKFKPGILSSQDSIVFSGLETFTDELVNAQGAKVNEVNTYIEDEWLIHKNFGINAGMYASIFMTEGKNHILLDPRLSANWQLSRPVSIHLSVNKVNQPLHLLSRTGSAFPTDLWVPATAKVKPQNAWLFDAEVRVKMSRNWKLEVHGYRKTMNNLINYIDGAFNASGNTISAINWEDRVTVGQGESKGIELMIKRDNGIIRGWLSYTLSETTRHFDNLNKGLEYPFRYDQRHVINVVGSIDIGKRWVFSSNWNYSTGSNINLAYSDWQYIRQDGSPDIFFFDFGGRNGFKLPAYHRLDLAVKYDKPTKWGKWSLDIGVYNAYNRINLFNVRPEFDLVSGVQNYKSTSLIPILPYFSFNIEL